MAGPRTVFRAGRAPGVWQAACYAAILLLSGCVGYGQLTSPLEQHLQAQQPDKALQALEAQRHAERDKVIYFLDKAMLLRMSGDWQGSNENFEQAKQRIEQLDAVSVREQAAAVSINDTLRSYAGERFERILLHVYGILNYLEAGRLDQARVEVLQLDVLLRQQEDGEPQAAFARYLSGLVFESQSEWSDAMIAYRKAYQSYRQGGKQPVPDYLQSDLLRLSERLGLMDEHEQYRQEFGQLQWQRPRSDKQAELVIFLHNGLVPRKREQAIFVQDPGSGRMISVATPYYETREAPRVRLRVVAGDQHPEAQSMMDVAAVARKSLEAQMPGIISRALARAVVKNQASKAAEQKDALAGFLVNVAGVLTERADMRAWYTLPQDILMARLPIPDAAQAVQVELQDSLGRVVVRELPARQMPAGGKRFVSLHWPVSKVTKWRP